MQSSFMNALPARLNEATQSRLLRSSGPEADRSPRPTFSVAVDNAESSPAESLVSFTSAPCQQAHGCADTAGEQEPAPERDACDERQVSRELAAHVGRLAELRAERLDSAGELLALVPDLVAQDGRGVDRRLVGGSRAHGWRSASVGSFASSIACSGTGVPARSRLTPIMTSTAATIASAPPTIRSAAHIGSAVAIPAAADANMKPSPKSARTAPPTASAIPTENVASFCLSSRAARRASRRARLDARSATCFAASPRPTWALVPPPVPLVAWVRIAPPVDDPGGEDADRERGRRGQEGVRPAAPLLGPVRRGRLDSTIAAHPLEYEAWLRLAQERRVVAELVHELGLDAARRLGAVRQLLEAVGPAVDECVAGRHRLAGGSSPVATRQIPEAARRATIVETAALPA